MSSLKGSIYTNFHQCDLGLYLNIFSLARSTFLSTVSKLNSHSAKSTQFAFSMFLDFIVWT